ncbi:MAG: hypothetical protein ACP5MB_11750, partial [bacterium]
YGLEIYNGNAYWVLISGGSTTAYQVWNIWASSSAAYLSLNYGTTVSASGSAFTASTSSHPGIGSQTTSYQIKVQWFRLRAYPPSGVMPGVSFGTVQSVSSATLSISPNPSTYPNGNITLFASCIPTTATCEVEFPVGKVVASGTGSASYTINSILAAGSYVASANVIGYAGNTTGTIT